MFAIERLATELASIIRAPVRRTEIVELLGARGLSMSHANAVIAYALVADLVVEDGDTLRPPGQRSRSTPPPAGAWLLLVEDDDASASAIEGVLTDEGHAVHRARNGREALRVLAKRGQPKAVVLDLMMPEIDGWHLFDILREDEELHSVPVIVVTAAANPPKGVRVLRKPLILEQLLSAVRETTGFSQI
jgi:CheY-like chemotaxis protein